MLINKNKLVMKKFLFALVAAVALLFAYSCDKEDKENAKGDSSIVGTWEYEGVDYYDEEYYIAITFKSNGRGVWKEYVYDGYDDYSEVYGFEYDYSDNYLEIFFDDGEYEAFECVIKGNRMIIDDELVLYRR